jgi:hypothetical protein
MKTPAEILRESATLFEEKNVEHGNTFENIGNHFEMLFPLGITLKTANDFNVFYNFMQAFSKLGRLASCMFNITKLKHEALTDSPRDLQCYAAMLQKVLEDRSDYGPPPVFVKEIDN